MNITRKAMIVLTAASLGLTGLGLVSAQESQTNSEDLLTQRFRQQGQRFPAGQQFQQGRRGMPAGPQGRQDGLLPRGVMTEGTSLAVKLYDGHPDEAGQLLETLTHVVGESSERVFMESVREAMTEAAYLEINIGESSRIITLPERAAGAEAGRGRGLPLPLRNLNEASTLTVEFYAGDPDEGAEVLATVSFVQGETSEVSFANEVRDNGAAASHAVVTTSPQTKTIDLSVMREHATDLQGKQHQGQRRQQQGSYR